MRECDKRTLSQHNKNNNTENKDGANKEQRGKPGQTCALQVKYAPCLLTLACMWTYVAAVTLAE